MYSDREETKSYYLWLTYLAFLKIYSSFSSEDWENDNTILIKLLSIIQVIIRDKNAATV